MTQKTLGSKILHIARNIVKKFLPLDIAKRLDEIDDRLNGILKELVHIYAVIGKFSDKYDGMQSSTNATLKAQVAVNQRLFRRMQDILTALKDHKIEVKDETLH